MMRVKVLALVGFQFLLGNMVFSQTERLSGSVIYEIVWTTTYPIQAKGMLCFNEGRASFIATSDFTVAEANGKGNEMKNENISMVETAPGHFTVVRRRDPNTLKESKSVPFNIFTFKAKGKLYQACK